MSEHQPNKLPWKWVAVTGGWDGIADADGHVLFKMAENNPVNADFAVRCVNSHEALVKALKASTNMLSLLYDITYKPESRQAIADQIKINQSALTNPVSRGGAHEAPTTLTPH